MKIKSNMKKQDLYTELNLGKYYWGGAFLYSSIDIVADEVNILDQICTDRGFTPLGHDWNEIDYKQFDKMLHSALQFDLGFTKHEIMNEQKTNFYFNILLKGFDVQNVRCFSNWYNNPWENLTGGVFNSISINTMDLALAILDKNQALFVYFLFED